MQNKIMRQIDSLKFDPANSRKHDERNIKSIMDSLKMHGQRKPIVIYSDMIIAGNGTVEAAKRLGWSEVWVNNDSFDSIEHAKAYAVQDNRTAELAAWDDQQLGDTLTELKEAGWDLKELGFDDDEFKKLIGLEDENIKEINEDDIKEFCIFISCKNEIELQELYEEMIQRGYEVKLT
jgi:ParB family chromosome partitioning protein